MNPYSGLVDLFEGKDLLKKEGNSLVYTLATGEIIKKFRKAWERNEDGALDKAMVDFVANPHQKSEDIEELEAEVEAVVEDKSKKSKKEVDVAE
jgi:hypothetical protein